MKLLNNNHSLPTQCLTFEFTGKQTIYAYLLSDKQWPLPHSLRGGAVQQVRFGASQKNKNKQRMIYCIDCVCSSFRKRVHKTHKTITTATKKKIQMVCSQFALQTTFSLCYCRQVLLGRKCGALISPEADSTGSPPASVWSRSCCLPLQNL